MSEILPGTPMYPSLYVPEDQLVVFTDPTSGKKGIYFHQRISVRKKMRRPHGRTNGPRRWKVRKVLYRPAYDRIKEQLNGTTDT